MRADTLSHNRLTQYEGWRAYALAACLVAVVAAVRFLLNPLLSDEVPLLPFIIAVLGGSVAGGLPAGVFATFLSGFVGEILFVRPAGALVILDVGEWLRLALFILEGVLVSAVIEVLRRARLDAVRANAEKDGFIAMLAHEFRSPINAVQTALAVMKTRQTDERRTWARDVIERQATVMSRLVDDLLDAARIRHGTFGDVQRLPTPLRTIVDSAIASVQPLIDEREIEFQADLTADAIVLADPIRLQQAIGNLLTNACRYTQAGGRVSITVGVMTTVNVTIRDTGIGIAPDDLQRLFEPFQRGPQSTGLGLGLFLARTFVQYSGGTLDATSTGQGTGSTFVIRLPLLRQDSRDQQRSRTRSA